MILINRKFLTLPNSPFAHMMLESHQSIPFPCNVTHTYIDLLSRVS